VLVRELALPYLMEIMPAAGSDADAAHPITQVFHAAEFARLGLAIRFAEEYVVTAPPRAMRGLEVAPPAQRAVTMIWCFSGRVLAAAVDLRVGSPTYQQTLTLELSAGKPAALYVPPGVAHAVYALEGPAVLLYKATAARARDCGGMGVRWDSTGIAWPDAEPVLSARDRALPRLADFRSPFRFERKDEETGSD